MYKNKFKERVEYNSEIIFKSVIDFPKFDQVFYLKNQTLDFEDEEWGEAQRSDLEKKFKQLQEKDKVYFCQKKIPSIKWKKLSKSLQKEKEKQDQQDSNITNNQENKNDDNKQTVKQEQNVQSNASIVEWEDGTFGLLVGKTLYELNSEYFNAQFSTLSNHNNQLFAVQNFINKKFAIQPDSKQQISLEKKRKTE
ncbi:hypothetical protein PPERSA_06386 [Pseudocohnilembus persalinus]|uniref:Uncharacterized protein n=1 Tax=Pseudocohnilembus persalinus TaxID=266149 RepID=A0A0V0QIR8_PSEPJ|nr:hypothetical protein PPERSA_06386 [Pseudocohnilembus persalinus]|eukprot:KRX02191.1 hypothetical protein PPERSA_06386 [Pseudocohnilembus persalinus]